MFLRGGVRCDGLVRWGFWEKSRTSMLLCDRDRRCQGDCHIERTSGGVKISWELMNDLNEISQAWTVHHYYHCMVVRTDIYRAHGLGCPPIRCALNHVPLQQVRTLTIRLWVRTHGIWWIVVDCFICFVNNFIKIIHQLSRDLTPLSSLYYGSHPGIFDPYHRGAY